MNESCKEFYFRFRRVRITSLFCCAVCCQNREKKLCFWRKVENIGTKNGKRVVRFNIWYLLCVVSQSLLEPLLSCLSFSSFEQMLLNMTVVLGKKQGFNQLSNGGISIDFHFASFNVTKSLRLRDVEITFGQRK